MPPGDTAQPDDPAPGPGPTGRGVELLPRVAEAGRYHRAHVANAALRVEGDELVVVDGRDRPHRFRLDGSAAAPAAVGVTLNTHGPYRSVPAYLTVLDGQGRLLVRDAQVGLWRAEDIGRFAGATGLGLLPPADRPLPVVPGRPPVDLEPVSRAPLVLLLALLPVAAVCGATGVPPVVAGPVIVALVVGVFLARNLHTVRLGPGSSSGVGRRGAPLDEGRHVS